MKKLMTFTALFMGIVMFASAQTNIAFQIKSNNGKILIEENGTYSMGFGITGLTTEADVTAFQKTVSGNSTVKNFEIFNTIENGGRKASLVLVSKEKEKIVGLLKSSNVTKLVVDGKDYSIDEYDKMTADLKAKQKSAAGSASKSK